MNICQFHAPAAHLGRVFIPARALQTRVAAGAWNHALTDLHKKPALFDDAEIILLIEAVNVNDY